MRFPTASARRYWCRESDSARSTSSNGTDHNTGALKTRDNSAPFVATANSLGSVPAVLRETMSVIELPGYTDADKRVIAAAHLLPWQFAHGLTADQVRVTDEAIEAMIGGYTWGAGESGRAGPDGTRWPRSAPRWCATGPRGDEAPVEVTPEILAGMLGPPSHRKAEVVARTGRTGVVLELSLGTVAGGDLLFVEVSRMPGTGALTLTGGLGGVMQDSARVALSWVAGQRGAVRHRPALQFAAATSVVDHSNTYPDRFRQASWLVGLPAPWHPMLESAGWHEDGDAGVLIAELQAPWTGRSEGER